MDRLRKGEKKNHVTLNYWNTFRLIVIAEEKRCINNYKRPIHSTYTALRVQSLGWWAYTFSMGEFPSFFSIMEFLSPHMHNLWMYIQLHTCLYTCYTVIITYRICTHLQQWGVYFPDSLTYLTCSYLIQYLYNRRWLLKRYNKIKVLKNGAHCLRR